MDIAMQQPEFVPKVTCLASVGENPPAEEI
jgi:hypothetical protein